MANVADATDLLREATRIAAGVDRLFEDAGKKLGDVSKDKKKYQGILKNLILEGAYALNEDKLQIKVRKADNDVAKQAIEEAQKEYKSAVNKDVTITIDESDPLPAESYVCHHAINFNPADP